MPRLVVYGHAVTEGSTQAFVKGDRAVVVQGGSADRRRRLQDWRQAIAQAARDDGAELIEGPVWCEVVFGLQRPQSAPKRRRTWPTGARSGDIDKLTRAVLDALTGVAWRDDSQVVGVLAMKDYTARPGVVVSWEAAEALELDAAELG